MRAVILSHEYADPAHRGKLKALAGLGCAITAAVPGGTGGSDGPVRIASIRAGSDRAAPERQPWSRRGLTTLLRDLRPDLVQIESEPQSRAAAAATAVAHRLGIPTLAFSWESLARDHPLFARRRRRLVLARASGVIGGNSLATGLLRATAPEARHATIPQFGLTVPPLQEPRNAPGLVIGFIGRLVPERGVEFLLRACNHVMGAWSVAILGTGPAQEDLEALAQRLGQASRLRWLGGAGRDAIDQFWTEIDVLVVPSRATRSWVERHHPLLLEAMARAIPVVTTDTGALPELVGDAGIVVSDAESMGLALQQLLADPAERQRLGLAARQRVLRHYADSAIAKRTLEFWTEVVGGAPRLPGAD